MESYRLFFCAKCREETHICRHCDRGQIYCGPDCAEQRRRKPHRRAVSQYQEFPIGKVKHRVNQHRYRHKSDLKLIWLKNPPEDLADLGIEITAFVVPGPDGREAEGSEPSAKRQGRRASEAPEQASPVAENAPIGKTKHLVNQHRCNSVPEQLGLKNTTKDVTDRGTEISAFVVPCPDDREAEGSQPSVEGQERQASQAPEQALPATGNAQARMERSDERVPCDFCGQLCGPFVRFGFSRCGSPTLRFRTSKG